MNCAKSLKVFGIMFILAFSVSQSAQAMHVNESQSKVTNYRWKQLEMNYPAEWKIDADADHNETRNVRLIPRKPKYPVIVILTINPDAPDPDKTYHESPALAALAFGNSIAAQAAGRDDAEGGFISYGEVQLGDGSAAAAQIILPVKGSKRFASVQSFVTLKNGYMVLGAVIIFGEEGKVLEDPIFHRDVASAYAILRSIHIRTPQN